MAVLKSVNIQLSPQTLALEISSYGLGARISKYRTSRFGRVQLGDGLAAFLSRKYLTRRISRADRLSVD